MKPLLALLPLFFTGLTLSAQFSIDSGRVSLKQDEEAILQSPAEGLWSVATAWKDQWPGNWKHIAIQQTQVEGPWTLVSGALVIGGDSLHIRDAYRNRGDYIQVVRRWEWIGDQALDSITLSVRWQVAPGARALLPGVLYYGNPSAEKTQFGFVPYYHGTPGEALLVEEHRFPMPFVTTEWKESTEAYGNLYGAALHSLPSPVPQANQPDQWWSMGVKADVSFTELQLLSGPCTVNGMPSTVKFLQKDSKAYPNTWLRIEPGTIIEKTFFLEIYSVDREGAGFQPALGTSLEIFQPYGTETFPSFREIIEDKYRFAKTRWETFEEGQGFRMYHDRPFLVMGWAGQSETPGYAFQVLSDYVGDTTALSMAQKTLDFLATAPLDDPDKGFPVRYNYEKKEWSRPDYLSQGQALESFTRAIEKGRGSLDTKSWEEFVETALAYQSKRILSSDWNPVSTNEAFLISPLFRAAKLFDSPHFEEAALKATEHYGERHIDMYEPYWGGTLDARAEDKEGAWAAFQAFLAAFEYTGDMKYLAWAEHACEVMLTYTFVWNVAMPPGRMSNHHFASLGWTSVSVQNHHLDVYGVVTTPAIYRLGELTGREELKDLALVMYRTCGQLIDPFGSQGEQIQQTNYSQNPKDRDQDVFGYRGGYFETWTVFWITAHFLHAAAQFVEMGVIEE
ncbi:MAG: hypothetical protein AAGA10_14330 [Bacteroidota bacterium]